ncbi:GIN domain-containing protein [Telluria beijingensis]|uniref:GIN domain-containing protein n=1 Tax=Telluria beijingensis TaxID=3068633 RepID=UPI0027957B58|nr:DUF2807 domain-containing protein [Massilia sp. REN29]
MNHLIKLGAAVALLGVSIGIAGAAPETGTETRTIDARVVRVKLEGVGDLRIRQGTTPSLVLTGDARLLSRTTTAQRGDTLQIETEGRNSGFSFGRSSGLQAELVLPNLRAVSSESVGSTTVTGFAGETLEINLDGAGSMSVSSSDYRNVKASLGGVGNLKIQGVNSETVDLSLGGAGYVTLSGRSKRLRAELGGLGGLDAQACTVDAVTLDLSGLGNASVHARDSVNLALSGMGSVTVFGKPANRKVALDGLGKVNWK